MKCNNDCLNCTLLRCKHDVEDRQEYVDDVLKKKRRKRKAEYYLENKERIDARQKEWDKKYAKEKWARYYATHKAKLNAKSREYYKTHKKQINDNSLAYYYAHREEILERRKQRRLENAKRSIEQDLHPESNE